MLRKILNKLVPRYDSSRGEFFDQLPLEVIQHILSFLRCNDLRKIAKLNRQLQNDAYHLQIALPRENIDSPLQNPTYYELIKEHSDWRHKKFNLPHSIEYVLEPRLDRAKNTWHGDKVVDTLLGISVICLSLGTGIYVGQIFHKLFDSYFIAIENGIIFGAASAILHGGAITCIYGACNRFTFFSDKISKNRNRNIEAIKQEIKHTINEYRNLPEPRLEKLKRNFK